MFLLDRLLASRLDRTRALEEASYAIRDHGNDALGHLKTKLDAKRGKKSVRRLRLAMQYVRRRQRGKREMVAG